MSRGRHDPVILGAAAGWLDGFAPGVEPLWLLQRRAAASRLVRALGLPAPSDEAWRFTPTEPVNRIPFEPVPHDWRPEAAPPWLEESLPRWPGEHRVLLVDGHLVEESAPAGVEVLSLERAWHECPDLVSPHLGCVAAPRSDRALAWRHLNTALFGGGVVLRFRAGVAARAPVHLVLASDRHGGPTVVHPRVLLIAEAGSEGTVVQTWVGPGHGAKYLVNEVTEVAVGAGAAFEHLRVQQEGDQAYHLGTVAVSQGNDSRYTSRVISAGGRLARLDLEVALAAPGAECHLDGIYVAAADQHQAHHTAILHRQPHTTSRERYRGVLTGKASAVFDGRIEVHRDAQKTSAHQENHNLLLSEEARVHSKPSLEIDADDVQCGHGATVGQLDREGLFYLRSRGIDERDARGILITAFAREILDGIAMEPLRRRLARELFRQIPECGDRGEL